MAAIRDAVDAMIEIPIRRWTAVGGKMSTERPIPSSMMHVTNVPRREVYFYTNNHINLNGYIFYNKYFGFLESVCLYVLYMR